MAGLSPDQFWAMSWREVDAWMGGASDRAEAEWQRTAQLGAWVLSPWSKKKLTGKDLFKPQAKKGDAKKADPEHVTKLVHKLAGIPDEKWQPSHL